MSARFALPLALAALVLAAPAAAASADAFTGVWTSPDTDGDYVRFAISAPGPDGLRRLAGFDPAAEACNGGPAVATGVGTVVGDTLTTTLTVRCDGTIHFVGGFYFVSNGDTLVSNTSLAPYTRAG